MNTSSNPPQPLWLIDLGPSRYGEAWKYQKQLLGRRAADAIPDCLITTEHHPVLTLGRGTDRKNLLANQAELRRRGVELFEIERGGDITFHGPGQLVLYPIIDLRRRDRDSHRYLRDLEQITIRTLTRYGLAAELKSGLTGIWVQDTKVAAIGVALSKWITYHGIAINVNTDLSYFDLINPCGITEFPVGSVADRLGYNPGLDELRSVVVEEFVAYYGYEPQRVTAPESLEAGPVSR